MKILYFDCFSGASGDMILGALLDAGANIDVIKSELAKLPFAGYTLSTERVSKKGISALQLIVNIKEAQQPHRHYSDIKKMLEESNLLPRAKEISLAVFERLAIAEGKIHGRPLEKVHFHEVGAVDSIVDIVGTAIALVDLHVEKIYASAINTGSGTVHCAHGELPVPAPATLEMLTGVPVYAKSTEGELLTPTGAAILTTMAVFGPLPAMTVLRSGYGAGQKDTTQANVLRVTLGEIKTMTDYQTGTVTIYEATIDDMNPEFYGYIIEKLLSAGAVDVTLTPVYMKKNRPGTMITALVHAPHEDKVLQMLFAETTTLGVRKKTAEKLMLARRLVSVQTPYGAVSIKLGESAGTILNASPEYEDCANLARQANVPLKTVYCAALTAFNNEN